MTRVSASEQPSGFDSIAGGPPSPSAGPASSTIRSYCTPAGKSSAVKTVRSSLAPGQVAVPDVVVAQPVSAVTTSSAAAAAPTCWLFISPRLPTERADDGRSLRRSGIQEAEQRVDV